MRTDPTPWPVIPAGSVARIEIGGTPSRNNPAYWADGEAGHPWLSIADLNQKWVFETAERITDAGVRNSNVKPVPAGTPVMSFKLTIGRVALAGRNLFTNEAIAAFHVDPSAVDRAWLYHALPRATAALVTDTAVKGITLNKGKLLALPLDLPPLDEQRRIAAVLDTLDEAIHRTEQVIAKLQQMRQGLLHDLLTRGVDENGDLRPPPEESPHLYKDSPLGRIPSCCHTVPLASLAAVNPRCHPAGLPSSAEVSFIPMQDVSEDGDWTGHQTRRFSEVSVGYTPFSEGDVLFAKITPCMENGKGTHARGLVNGIGFGSTEFHVLRAMGDNCDRFIYHWSRAPALRLKAQAFMIGSAGQQRVQPDFFEHFLVPGFPPSEQRRIAAILDAYDATIRRNREAVACWRQSKQGLLHDLLTGRVRVPDSIEVPA